MKAIIVLALKQIKIINKKSIFLNSPNYAKSLQTHCLQAFSILKGQQN
jgi:hypothetical protein